jgi:hypothetical protein
VLIGKVILLLIGMIWVRATLPRIRYDRLMALGWKILLPVGLVAVFWSALSIMIGDALGSPVAYGIASGILFVVIVGIGYVVLRRSGDLAESEPAMEDDPIITGERRGPAWVGLQIVGAVIGIPFALWNFTLKALDSLASLAPEEKKDESSTEQTSR